MPYAFFLDIDGTLIDYKFVPAENRIAIDEARDAGHLVFLNTGRSYRFIPNRVWDHFEFDGIVCGSGSYASLGDKLLLHRTITPSEAAEDAKALMAMNQPFIFEGEHKVLVWGTPPQHDYWLPIESAEELTGIHADVNLQKINLPGQASPEAVNYLTKRYHLLQFPTYAEIAIIGCDKGKGMDVVMANLPEGFVSVAIGDSLNDREMLTAARISVAMGNSTDEVKALCTHETASVRDAGVAVAIRAILCGEHKRSRLLQNSAQGEYL